MPDSCVPNKAYCGTRGITDADLLSVLPLGLDSPQEKSKWARVAGVGTTSVAVVAVHTCLKYIQSYSCQSLALYVVERRLSLQGQKNNNKKE